MKKITLFLLIAFVLLSQLTVYAENINVEFNSINIEVDNQKIDTPNILYNGVTYVPLRSVSEALGCDVNWNDSTFTASISNYRKNALFEASNIVNYDLYNFHFLLTSLMVDLTNYYNAIVFDATNPEEVGDIFLSDLDYISNLCDERINDIKNTNYDYYLYICSETAHSLDAYLEAFKNIKSSLVFSMTSNVFLKSYKKTKDPIDISNYATYRKTAEDSFLKAIEEFQNFSSDISKSYFEN